MNRSPLTGRHADSAATCGRTRLDNGQRWEDFTHATDEVVIVLKGDMEFEVEGQVHHPEPGEELLIPAEAVHSARNIGSTTARWLYGYRDEA